MASFINLKKINDLKRLLDFQQRDVDEFGKKITKKHLDQIRLGIDADSRQFQPYTEGYKKRKGAGTVSRRQVSTQTHPPNLTLTGDMLNAFKYIKGHGGKAELEIDYGIEDVKQAKKLRGNQTGRFRLPNNKIIHRSDKKRVIARHNKVGPMVESLITAMFAVVIARNIQRRLKRQTVITYEM